MNEQNTTALRQTIIEIGRRLGAAGLVAGADGNISCRLLDNNSATSGYLITKSGVAKGYLEEADILQLDINGQNTSSASPSIETAMHLAIYAASPEVNAIIHAHPPYATAFALGGVDINSFHLEEMRITLGQVSIIPYAEAGSAELAKNAAHQMTEAKAGLLSRHGAISVGTDLIEALYRMETLEHSAKIISISQGLFRR